MLKTSKNRTDQMEKVVIGLKKAYRNKLQPLEEAFKFYDFHSSLLSNTDFESKPMVLLFGQYSTGKSSFIRYLLENDFPGIRIGPEPTTDCFTAVMYADYESVIPGNALVFDPSKNFESLSKFGTNFLNRFESSQMPNEVLKSITFIDTPGILSGEKQRLNRGYDFAAVLEWFADRCDRILLLFDAHKLDISDELKSSIEVLRRNDDKIRIVLNKADSVDSAQLIRVYGALMWSLGKVLKTPEVCRVYVGSFWENPIQVGPLKEMFEREAHQLFKDLHDLPKFGVIRKLNDLIKRARSAKAHAYIISELKARIPVFGKESKKKELIKDLDKIYEFVMDTYKVSAGDMPNINKMREDLENIDLGQYKVLDKKLIQNVDSMLSVDMTNLMQMISKEEFDSLNKRQVNGGAFSEFFSQTSHENRCSAEYGSSE